MAVELLPSAAGRIVAWSTIDARMKTAARVQIVAPEPVAI
jgi:hypothetical protein